jgi:hypothetical protein
MAAVYDLQDLIGGAGPYEASEDLQADVDGWAQDARSIADDEEEKRNNMPDQLQESDTGYLLEERANACNAWADEMEAVEIPRREDFDDEDDFLLALEEAYNEIESLEPEGI